MFNTWRPEKNSCYFTGDIFNCIYVNENYTISIWILLKCVPEGDNQLALVQVTPVNKLAASQYLKIILAKICGAIWHH